MSGRTGSAAPPIVLTGGSSWCWWCAGCLRRPLWMTKPRLWSFSVKFGQRYHCRVSASGHDSVGAPPDGVGGVAEVVRRLCELREWAALPEREIHRRVLQRRVERGIAAKPAFDTVRRCFSAGRARLDMDLVADIVAVLQNRDTGE